MNANTPEMKRAALYVRVSTDDQMELSPDAQQRLLLDYAKSHNMITENQYIYIEGGRSGRHANKRPEFQRMIAAAKAKQFDTILVWKYSRFARNQEESIVYKSLLQKNHVDVISISEPTIDGPFGSLIERIIEWMDEYYSIRLSGEVTRGMTEKALRGGYQAQPPIGYRMEGNKKTGYAPQIVPDEAKFIHIVFDQFESGKDFSSIALYCNDLGYRTRRGGLWENRTIKYILQNPFYIGKVRWNRAKHDSHIENAPDEIIIRDGIHEPIITIEQWENVQKMLEQKITPYKARTSRNCKHWLSGMIKCNTCGGSLGYHGAYVDKRGRNCAAYYQCCNYIKGKHSGSQLLMERAAVECVLSALEDALVTSVVTFRIRNSSALANITRQEKLQRDLEKIKDRENRCKIAYQEGIDTIEEYKENKKKLQAMRDEITAELEELKPANEEPDVALAQQIMLSNIKNVLDILKSENSDNETKRNALMSIVERIVYIKEEKRLDIYYYLNM